MHWLDSFRQETERIKQETERIRQEKEELRRQNKVLKEILKDPEAIKAFPKIIIKDTVTVNGITYEVIKEPKLSIIPKDT